MIRVIFETSLPFRWVGRVRADLAAYPVPGTSARLERDVRAPGCEGPAQGGSADWTPCWVSVESEDDSPAPMAEALARVKSLVVEACREGGSEVFAIPANARIGDDYYRFRDLSDVVKHLERR